MSDNDGLGRPWRVRAREGLRATWEVLADITSRPVPEPVLYLRCDSCGQIAPRTTVRHHGRWAAGTPGVEASPPEYPCPLCGTYSPRVLGDQADPGDPEVATVAMTCTARFGALLLWRRCATGFAVPATAATVMCPACGERYPGPAR